MDSRRHPDQLTTPLLDRHPEGPVIVDDTTRRQFITAVVAAGLVTGCGRNGGEAAPPAETRTISHAAGVTEVPVDARRIVTLQDQNALLPLLELGVKPVASAGLLGDDSSRTFGRTEGFDTSGIEFVGEYGEPNLEAIARVGPDLIVCDEFSASEVYDELSRIAHLTAAARDLDLEGAVGATYELNAEALAALEPDVILMAQDQAPEDDVPSSDEVREKHADVVDDVEVSIGNIVDDAVRLSMEGRKDLSFLESNPLFQGLGAVKAGNVHFVSNYWEFGGAGSARHVLDDIDTALEAFATSGAGA